MGRCNQQGDTGAFAGVRFHGGQVDVDAQALMFWPYELGASPRETAGYLII